ncbi:MAG: hypothetical protein JWP57_4616 [Spirosoma sp.]|nr:hypothetical protein [Spirosoma sp.]
MPAHSTTWYFPVEQFIDSSLTRVLIPKELVTDSMQKNVNYLFLLANRVVEQRVVSRIDTFKLNWFSYYLYKLQEPVLYNYPLGKEVYRLTWIRSFHPPVVIRLEKDGNRTRLTTKILSRIPELPGHWYSTRDGTIHLADTSASIGFRKKSVRTVPKAVYNEYVRLFVELKASFISPLGFRTSLGSDGSEWILETHKPDGYQFIVRWSPKQKEALRTLGDYLLNISDARKEERY